MVKRIICIIIAFFLSPFVLAGEPDFRNVSWGMSHEQVIKNETLSPVQQENDTVIYQSKVNDLDCFLAYRFVEDKLYFGAYFFQEEYTNYNSYISDYKNLKELLEKKYGKITDNDVRITNEMAHGLDPGTALTMGYLGFVSQWETDTTEICLMLYGDNFKCTLVVSYESKKYTPLAKRVKEEKLMDVL